MTQWPATQPAAAIRSGSATQPAAATAPAGAASETPPTAQPTRPNGPNETSRTDILLFLARYALLLCLFVPRSAWPSPLPAAAATYDSYVAAVDARLQKQHAQPTALVLSADVRSAVHSGGVVVEAVNPGSRPATPGALLHHWRGTVFVPGAPPPPSSASSKTSHAYPQAFAPEVLRATATPAGPRPPPRIPPHPPEARHHRRPGHHLRRHLRPPRPAARIQRLPQHLHRRSRLPRHPQRTHPPPAEEHGFLWQLNTYWSWEERDGGLYLQVESVSLSRAIPLGLSWALRPYVESVPRESLAFTLRSARNALQGETR